jgi:mannonate dehydratase
MIETWRWFGPEDKVTLSDIRQTGASGIVTSLYHLEPGMVWKKEEISSRLAEISGSKSHPTNLSWQVVESLPVSEVIKTGSHPRDEHIKAWIESMENLSELGINVICYNFMPILDWTRTELAAPMSNGATAMYFDLLDFIAFDCFILERINAQSDYEKQLVDVAKKRFEGFSKEKKSTLSKNITAGLPGAGEKLTFEEVKRRLEGYSGIDADKLRENFKYFLDAVVPTAEKLGVRLCCHPDDPPWPLLGLPRIMSTEEDYNWLVNIHPSKANGITFCTGSLGASFENDLPGMVSRMGQHIHFLHLRNVTREQESIPTSFYEDEHLSGNTDMIETISEIIREENRRKAEGREDWSIPMRPDHGQNILDDHGRNAMPGYPAIGRLKGLAELRGVFKALEHKICTEE